MAESNCKESMVLHARQEETLQASEIPDIIITDTTNQSVQFSDIKFWAKPVDRKICNVKYDTVRDVFPSNRQNTDNTRSNDISRKNYVLSHWASNHKLRNDFAKADRGDGYLWTNGKSSGNNLRINTSATKGRHMKISVDDLHASLLRKRNSRSPKRRRMNSAMAALHGRKEKTFKPKAENDPEHLKLRQEKARKRFRRACKMVCMVAFIIRTMMHITKQLTVRTAVETQWYVLNTTKEARKLAFNPALYVKDRIYSKLPEWAKEILEKIPEERSGNEVKRLHALCRSLRNFNKFSVNIQLAMCKAFTYQSVEDQRIILREGHVGQQFYFIYSGSVFVNAKDVNKDGNEFIKTEAILSKGDSFGELALLKEIKRQASITCRENCELLVVDKTVFTQVCPKIFDKEMEEKVHFLRCLPLFHSNYWKHAMLETISFDAQIQEYKINKVIVLDSTEEDWFYICIKGHCQIIKCLALEPNTKDTEAEEDIFYEDHITAEYLELQRNPGLVPPKSRSSRRRPSAVGLAESQQMKTRKGQLLQTMDLEYLQTSQRSTPEAVQATAYNQGNNVDSWIERFKKMQHNKKEESMRKSKTHSDGSMTLQQLLKTRAEEYKGQDFVYLEIGKLGPGEPFDLLDILQPSNQESGSTLILVSLGAKMIRLKKSQFKYMLSPAALENALQIARLHKYPSNRLLLQSYKDKLQWESYRRNLLADTVRTNRVAYPRRRKTVSKHSGGATDTPAERRLISTLEKRNVGESEEMCKITLALEESDDGICNHETFVSRMLKDADIYVNDLSLPVLFPGGERRRSSGSMIAANINGFSPFEKNIP